MKITEEQVSASIKHIIDERGITANELGRRMGKSSGRMSEKLGAKPSWKFSELFALADAIGVTPAYIVSELERASSGGSQVD